MATVAKTRKQQQQAISKVEETAETDPLVEEEVITNDDLKDEISEEVENNVDEAKVTETTDEIEGETEIEGEADEGETQIEGEAETEAENVIAIESEEDETENNTNGDDALSTGGVNDDVISSNDGEDINDEPIDDIISATELKVEGGEEDQDTEGDDMNDAEEIEADVDADSLEETEFVEGGVDEEAEMIEGDAEDPLVANDDEGGEPEVDPLMENEEDVNGMNYPRDETDVVDEPMEEEDNEGEQNGDDSGNDEQQTGTKRKSEEELDNSDGSVRKSSRIKIKHDLRKEKESALLEGKSVHDKQQEKTKMLQRPTERPTQITLISDEEGEQSDGDAEKEDDTVDSTETKPTQGDPSKPPGVGAARKIDIDFLVPFNFGWTREIVVRPVKSGPQQIDVFYWPPQVGEDFGSRNREARRKRRSKVDMEKYFDEFKHKTMSVNNFTFVRRPLELNNEAYEIVRHSKPSLETRSDKRTRKAPVRYKEVAEHEGLLSGASSDEEGGGGGGEEIEEVTDFDQGLPLSLQIIQRTTPFREEAKKRKKYPDRERCVTPPCAAELEWTVLDDDPLGIYTELGGRSSPATPPPLRAVRLTSHNTVTSSREKLEAIKADLVDPLIRVKEGTKDTELKENLASHDSAIKKYKNMRVPSLPFARNNLPNSKPGHGVPRLSGGKPGGKGSPSRPQGTPGVVKVKLPILSTNGKRPSVELVMLTNGKYQPIKFTNNRQVTETIPKRMFEQSNHMRKTLYQRSLQVPKIGTKPVFVAVNPSPQGWKPFIDTTPPPVKKPQHVPNSSEQVSILVRPATGGNAVLLNVPKAVAMKVKVGTTLSFSASSDLKYTVMDSKMHPPVGKKPPGANQTQAVKQQPHQRQLPNLPPGVSIRPIARASATTNGRRSVGGGGGGQAEISVVKQRIIKPARKSAPAAQTHVPTIDLTDFTPCSPFCPGVSGIPELECCICHSLFHPKCVGIPQSMVNNVRSTFQCRSCRGRPGASSNIQVIEID